MAQIKIQDIFPLLKPGWVAMDKNGIWRWYAIKPRISYDMWYRGGCSIVKISDCFDLLLFEGDWKDSLMEVRKYARTSRTKGQQMITIDQNDKE